MKFMIRMSSIRWFLLVGVLMAILTACGDEDPPRLEIPTPVGTINLTRLPAGTATATAPPVASPTLSALQPTSTFFPPPTIAPPLSTATPIQSVFTPTVSIPPTGTPNPALPPSGSDDDFDINESNQTLTLTCDGDPVTVQGSGNTITLLGSCGSIVVRGNSNTISYQAATRVTDTGSNNVIQQR